MPSHINPVVLKIGRLAISDVAANVVPGTWYLAPALRHHGTVRTRPNMVAITLLADILYWYRPDFDQDEDTGEYMPPRQRFKADRLQKDYGEWGALFGFSKEQVKKAMTFLRVCIESSWL